MKIIYDNVSPEYSYPLDSKKDLDDFKNIITDEVLKKIMQIRFGCNWKTTQEARIVQRGDKFDIRINFCLRDNRTPILSKKNDWIRIIKKFGGILENANKTVLWSSSSAKRYTVFLLLHEIGHIEYCIKYNIGRFIGKKSSIPEEQWCENYALEAINKFYEIAQNKVNPTER